MGSRNGELQDLSNRLIDRASRARANGIKVSIEKSKIQTSSSNNISANIMNGQRFQKVTSCKYLGTIPCKDDTCSAEICIRIDSAVTAMARLNRIWWSNTISSARQVQVAQVSCHLHPPLWLWNMHPDCWLREKNPQFLNQVPDETSSHLLLGAQDQQLGVEQDQLPSGPTEPLLASVETLTRMVQLSHMPRQPLQNKSHATAAIPKSSFNLGGWVMPWSAEELLDDNI